MEADADERSAHASCKFSSLLYGALPPTAASLLLTRFFIICLKGDCIVFAL